MFEPIPLFLRFQVLLQGDHPRQLPHQTERKPRPLTHLLERKKVRSSNLRKRRQPQNRADGIRRGYLEQPRRRRYHR